MIRILNQLLLTFEKEFNSHFPGNPFNYYFLEDIYSDHYLSDQQIGNLGNLFAMLALVIAGLGLFGFTSIMMVQKTKEIGIRKVLGASARSIFYKLSSEYLVLIIFASVIFMPIGLYLANVWLTEFSFRFSTGLWYYLLPTIILLIVAGIALSYHTFKAAFANLLML